MLRGLFIILLVLPAAITTGPAHGEESSGRAHDRTESDRTALMAGGADWCSAQAAGSSAGSATGGADWCSAQVTGDSAGSATGGFLLAKPFLAAISFYQRVISPQQGEVCAFQPTCSHFAQQALRTHGLVQGGLMISDRLQRCHGCASGRYGRAAAGRAHDPIDDHVLWGSPGGAQHPRRSPLLAALFSSVLPGAGKVYAGRPADGLYSLLVTGSSSWVAVSYGRDEHWGRAGLFGAMGLFFYLGNIYGSAVEAQRIDRLPKESLPADEDTLGFQSHYRIGLSCLHTGRWELAREELERAAGLAPTDLLYYRARLRLGQSCLSEGLPQHGEGILRDLLRRAGSLDVTGASGETRYWLGVSTLQQGRWVEASGWFRGLLRDISEGKTADGDRATGQLGPGDLPPTTLQLETAAGDLAGGDLTLAALQLETAARQGYRLPHRSPGLARAMSLFLPGSGQAYADRPWNGLLSLVFNAAAGYLTVDAFRDDRNLDGTLLLTLVWSRFYLGGLHNAGRHAEEFNRKRIDEHLQPYRPLMKPDYTD